jgi:putative oxidoreductase
MNDFFETYIPLIGRILLSLIFILSSLKDITSFGGMVGYMESQGMPLASLFLVGAILLKLAGGLSIAVGFQTRIGCLLLIIFLVPATLIFHNFWALEGQQAATQQIQFMKNLALMGGILVLSSGGPGRLSLDDKQSS